MFPDEINHVAEHDFVQRLGGVYESSPWVAEAVVGQRPFHSATDLGLAMRAAVEAAGPDRQLQLILAHPDLGGKLARRGGLSAESASEQSRLGLDQLEDAEFEEFSRLNSAYRERFGFPFIICVALVDKEAILAAFRERLNRAPDRERREALHQIHLIAGQRLARLLSQPSSERAD